MTTEERTAVDATQNTDILNNVTAEQTNEEVLEVEESSVPHELKPEVDPEVESLAPLRVKSEGEFVKEEGDTVKEEEVSVKVEGESVIEETAVAVEPNNSAAEIEPAAPAAVKELTEEESKGGESEVVVANGNSGYKRDENGDDSSLESDVVTILPHWHAKPCVHITGLAGVVTEEDLVPLLSPHGKIVSIVFENDRRDSAVVRYEPAGVESDDVVAKVRETINNKQIKERTLVVEPFRSDSLLFIGNLTPEIDDAVLRQMFETHGTVERALVLRNVSGRSKGYGFVEYSLKSQASAAKVAMGNINMDGRVLRVEWSDCRKISDMFSTVLFVDRVAKDHANIEQTLKNIFGKFGRVRDCHLAIGINGQFRGFGFIDFDQSISADKAHEALDGKDVEGSNIRVSFANPSKSAQSYKSRFGTQAPVLSTVNHGRTYPDHAIRPGGPMVGAAMRVPMGMPVVGNRYLAHGRSNLLGMSVGMQFGRGAPVGPGMIGRNLVSPLIGGAAGMLGPGSVAAGMIGRAPGLILGHTGQRALVAGGYGQQAFRLPSARGPVPISSVAIAQVATAQAKAREEDAKARSAAQAKQSQSDAKQSAAEQERLEQFRKMAAQQAQLTAQQNYYQQQSQSSGLDQRYKQGGSQYSYQQPYQQTAQLQSASHTQYQQPAAQQAPASQQSQQTYDSQHYSVPTQQYSQQAQQQQQHQAQPQSPSQQQQATGQTAVTDSGQYSQQQAYYQQPAQPSAQAAVSTQPQYAQYAQQYGQQYAQQQYQQQQQQQLQQQQVQQVQYYGQQPTAQQYTEATQQHAPAQYTQQDYANYYAQQQQPQTPQTQTPAAVAAASAVATPAQTVDASQQQQAYAAYYQQRAQEAVAQAGTTTSQTTTASTVGASTSLEAQWAAYYAAQAAHQQASGSTAAYDQQQTTYDQQQPTYAQQQPYAGTAAYYQQPLSVDTGQKRTADQIDYTTQAQASYSYPQQLLTASAGFTHQQAINGSTAYQQQAGTTSSVQQQPATAVTSYQQSAVGYPQQSAPALPTYPQQTSATSGYAPAVAGGYQSVATSSPSGYQQSGSLVAGYQQSSAAAMVSAYGQPNQSAVTPPVYDYSKRPRY